MSTLRSHAATAELNIATEASCIFENSRKYMKDQNSVCVAMH